LKISGSEAANAVVVVVPLLRFRRHQATIGAIHAEARVIRETIRVVADADLAISGMEAAVVAASSISRLRSNPSADDIEDTVGPVTRTAE